MATSTEQPFRFLDLPKEIRLMVYERLPITKSRVHVAPSRKVLTTGSSIDPDPPVWTTQWIPKTAAILTSTAPSLAVLATCHIVHDEARDVIMRAFMSGEYKPHALVDREHPENGIAGWLKGISAHDLHRDLRNYEVTCVWEIVFEDEVLPPSEEVVRGILLFVKRMMVLKKKEGEEGVKGTAFVWEVADLGGEVD